jgi:hypothetical protein
MAEEWSEEKINEMLSKAYLKDKQEEKTSQHRSKEIKKEDDLYYVVDYRYSKTVPKRIEAINKKIKESGIINHFVFDEKIGGYVCAGITFLDGQYLHLDPEVDQELVLMSTEFLGT